MEQIKHQITVFETGDTFACGENECILEAMKRANCGPIHYGCFGGGCGICMMKVVSGPYCVEKKMSRAHVTEQEERDGKVLICCVKPRGNVTIAQR